MYWKYRERPAEEYELAAQAYSEVYGSTGGVCGLRLRQGQDLSDPAGSGFVYDSSDKCWRCDGVTTFGGTTFVGKGTQMMLPPLVLNNDKAWSLSMDWVDSLPDKITVDRDVFVLAEVTIHEPGHFAALILVGAQWYWYNGMDGPGMLKPVFVSQLKKLKFTLCNAYYLIT